MRRKSILLVAALLAAGSPRCKDDVGDDQGGTAVTVAPPAAPTGLAGSPVAGTTQVALSWTDNSTSETGFRVEVNSGPFGSPPYAAVEFAAADAVSHTFMGLSNATYFFRVFAITATQESAPSNEVTVTTLNIPRPPFFVTALATGPASAEVRWVNDAGVTGNAVERSPDGTSWVQVYSGAATQVFADSGLAANTLYTYRASASTAAGASGPSATSSTRTQTPSAIAVASSSSDVGLRSSIAVSAGGQNHLSHFDNGGSLLLYTTNAGGPYVTSIADFGFPSVSGPGFTGTSLALDGAGSVHIAACNYYFGNDLRYVTNAGGSFVAATVAVSGVTVEGTFPQLRISPSDGTIQVVLRDPGLALRHAVRSGAGVWSVTNIPIGSVADQHGFAIDGTGVPHVILVSGSALWHAYFAAGSWQFEQITNQGQPSHSSLAIGAGGVLHAAFKDSSVGRLMYATNGGGSWSVEPVHEHTAGNLGRHNSIAVEPATGRVHIAYYNAVQGDLWHARKDPGGAWVRTLLDSAGDVGRHTSIALNLAEVRIGYYDFTNGDLRVAAYAP
jgi:hypothetical protein